MEDQEKKLVLSKNQIVLIVLLVLLISFQAYLFINIFKNKKLAKNNNLIKPTTTIMVQKPAGKIYFEANGQQVKLIFDSGNQSISGLDAILIFDPKIINLETITENKQLFNQIVINKQRQTLGQIRITAYLPKTMLVGRQILADFSYQNLKNQSTQITCQFNKIGDTADSNLLDQSQPPKDLLGEVRPLIIKAQ